MSDGGGESSSKQYKDRAKSRGGLGGDKFARAIARLAVAQIFEGAGVYGMHELARDTLSDVAVRYICEMGKLGNFYANLSGRSDGNVSDIIQSLEDLGLAQGYPGASDSGHCLADSVVVREIAQYVNEEGENPFVYAIPKFPIFRNPKSAPSFAQVGDSPPGEHIPTWLPVFPEPQTYTQEGHLNNPIKEIKPFREQRDADNSAANNLHPHISSNGFEAPIAVEGGDVAKGKQSAQNNAFLAPPLGFGEKEVASVVIPPKLLDGTAMRELEDHVPFFEEPSPVAKPMKSPLNDTEEVREMVSLRPSTRPTVQFKWKSFKKSPNKPLSVKIDDSAQMNSLFEINNNTHERKRRVEQLTMESMDIVEEFVCVKFEDSEQMNSLLEVDNDKEERKFMKEPMDIVEKSLYFKIDDSEQVNSLVEVNNDKAERIRRAEQIMKDPMDIVEEPTSVEIDESEKMNSLYEINNDKNEKKRMAEQIMKESMDMVEESAEL